MLKYKIKESFNKAVDSYNQNCQIQFDTGCKLIKKIQKLNLNPESVIDLGCGTGLITIHLFHNYPNSKKKYALDIADKLLQKAKKNLKKIIFIEDDFDSLANLSLDLVFSNMALQWSRNLSNTIDIITQNLQNNGILAFSTLLEGTFYELPINSRIKFKKFEEIKQILIDRNYKILELSNEKIVQNFPSFIHALNSIKNVGANYSGENNFLPLYRMQKENSGNFSLTYNIIYCIARKK